MLVRMFVIFNKSSQIVTSQMSIRVWTEDKSPDNKHASMLVA